MSEQRQDQAMQPTTLTLNNRDRAVLHAVSAGRCRMTSHALLVDGVYCADQFLADRLAQAGLITAAEAVRLTPSAQQLLHAT
jgi:hypothetical protein